MDINEDSLDLYTDLISEDYSNRPEKTESAESQDQISELLSNAKATIESLQIELQEKSSKEAALQRKIEILEKNNSSLLLTAKSELGRKNTIISDLKDQIDEHTKSLFYNGRFNKYPDKKQNYSSTRKCENSVSPVRNNRKRKNEETDSNKDSKRCRTTSGRDSISRYGSETDKHADNHSPKTNTSDRTSDKLKTCDKVRQKNKETFDLRDKLRQRNNSDKDRSKKQSIDNSSTSKSNKNFGTGKDGENAPKSLENLSTLPAGFSKPGVEIKLPFPDKAVDSDACLSNKEIKEQKSALVKQTSKCSIMDVVNKLSSKVSENQPKCAIPKVRNRRSSLELDTVMDSMSSSDDTEKLIVDLNSESDLKSLSLNSQTNTRLIDTRCSGVSVNSVITDPKENAEKGPKTFQNDDCVRKATCESDSDYASKLQFCVDMLSDSDPNETELWNTHRVFETSSLIVSQDTKIQKGNNKQLDNSKHDKDKMATIASERELMSPPKSLPKRKKCENKQVLHSDTNLKVSETMTSVMSPEKCIPPAQTQSIVNRIFDLSKAVALNSQIQSVCHKPPIENYYEEPKHDTISYCTWKTPQQLTFPDNVKNYAQVAYCKSQEQSITVVGCQDVPLSDPRTWTPRNQKTISDANIINLTPKPGDSVDNSKDFITNDKKMNDHFASVGQKRRKSHEKKTSSSVSKDLEKQSDRKDNDGVKVRLNLQDRCDSTLKDKTVFKTSITTSRASEDTSQQKNEELESGTQVKKASNKTSSKRLASSKCSPDEENVVNRNNDDLDVPETDLKMASKRSSKKKSSSSKCNKEKNDDKPSKSSTRRSVRSKDKQKKVAASEEDQTECSVTDKSGNEGRDSSDRSTVTLAIIDNENILVNTSDGIPLTKSQVQSVDSPVIKAESVISKSVTEPKESSEITPQIHPIEDIEFKTEPDSSPSSSTTLRLASVPSEPVPSTSSGLDSFSGMFMANLAGSNNGTEFLKRLRKIEEEIQMLKSAAMQTIETKVISKTENVQKSDCQPLLGSGTNDNPIIIPSSSDIANLISEASQSGLDGRSIGDVIVSANVTENQPKVSGGKTPSFSYSSETVSKDVASPLSPLSPVKASNRSKGGPKIFPRQEVADSSSGLGAFETCYEGEQINGKRSTKVSLESTEDSNSSNNSSFSIHSADSSVSSSNSFKTSNVRNSFTKHETLVSCNNSDTEDSLSESSEDGNDMDADTDLQCDKDRDLNQNAAEVLKTDLNMSSDSEDACKDLSNPLPQTPNELDKNTKTPTKQIIQSPWNRISPVPKFVTPENVNCDSKLLALVNLATLDLHMSGHDVPFENKALLSKDDNNSNVLQEVLSSTPCYRRTRSRGKLIEQRLPDLKTSETIDVGVKHSDSDRSISTSVLSSSANKCPMQTKAPVDTIPLSTSCKPKSDKVKMGTNISRTSTEQTPMEKELPQDVKNFKRPNIEDFKIFQAGENDAVADTTETISEKEDGEITQDSIIESDSHKQLSINTNSVYFVIDTNVDEDDELFKCSDAENSVSKKSSKKLVTPKKKQLSSLKTRSSPRIRDKSIRSRLGDKTERRVSDVGNDRRKNRRSPSPRATRSDGRRRLYDNNNIDQRSASKPGRKPLDSARGRGSEERIRYRNEPTRRSSRDRSDRDRYKPRGHRSRSPK